MNSDSPLIDSLSVPSLPPLRIHHFMLWTVVSAVMLTVLKTADEGTIGSSFTQTGNIPYLLIESLALCGLIAGLTWKRQGCRFFHQPGHAAMISYGINAIFLVCWATLWMRYGFSNTNGFGRSRFSFLLIYAWYAQLFLQVALSLLFAYQFRAVRRWQSFFWCKH